MFLSDVPQWCSSVMFLLNDRHFPTCFSDSVRLSILFSAPTVLTFPRSLRRYFLLNTSIKVSSWRTYISFTFHFLREEALHPRLSPHHTLCPITLTPIPSLPHLPQCLHDVFLYPPSPSSSLHAGLSGNVFAPHRKVNTLPDYTHKQ